MYRGFIIEEKELYPTCPFCEETMKDEDDLYHSGIYSSDNAEEGAIWETTCPSCNRVFYVRTQVHYSYETFKDEDHI